MRIFVYEFITGGGLLGQEVEPAPADSLFAEGSAMVRAVVSDLLRIPGVRVDVLCDPRLHVEFHAECHVHAVRDPRQAEAAFAALTNEADGTLVIAPELEGHLQARCARVEAHAGRLLGPGLELVKLASDKHDMAEHLARHGVPVPRGVSLAAGAALPADVPRHAVLKPRDGAGSQGVRRVRAGHGDADGVQSAPRDSAAGYRLEEFCPGQSASVVLLCAPSRIVPLAPCWQLLGGREGFQYLGGSLPLPPSLAQRASQLACRAIATLPNALGYLGVDLVLGDDPDGTRDVVIEINPRWTTSYVGLRALAHENLAEAWLAILNGRETSLTWRAGQVSFTSAGDVHLEPTDRGAPT